jgi:hypothetical protein
MPELETLIVPIAFTDLCRIYDYAIADATGEALPALPAYLHEIVRALHHRVWSSRADARLDAHENIPDWLAAQQIKERAV